MHYAVGICCRHLNKGNNKGYITLRGIKDLTNRYQNASHTITHEYTVQQECAAKTGQTDNMIYKQEAPPRRHNSTYYYSISTKWYLLRNSLYFLKLSRELQTLKRGIYTLSIYLAIE